MKFTKVFSDFYNIYTGKLKVKNKMRHCQNCHVNVIQATNLNRVAVYCWRFMDFKES